MTYRAPLRDLEVALRAFGLEERVLLLERFEDFDFDTVLALLRSANDVVCEEWAPTNEVGDRVGVVFEPQSGKVTVPASLKAAFDVAIQAGLLNVCAPAKWGGAGAPEPIGVCVAEMLMASNKSLSMSPQLTNGVIRAILAHGTDEQKDRYLPELVAGRCTGALSLTEDHCGSDLSMIRTQAERHDDGTYRITGNKTWITFGDHNLTSNHVHLLLARVDGAPAGLRGLSAFLVPKILPNGNPNAVSCIGVESKMGLHASPTCNMAFEGAEGELFGTENRGLTAVLSMLNMARLYVGLEGVAMGEAAYQRAYGFAKQRRQGRSLDPRKQDRSEPADSILVHPDIRQKLMKIRASTLALRGLAIWLAVEHELGKSDSQDAAVLVSLLTPVLKSLGSSLGFANCSEAMQVMGGMGYTRDGVEQYLRDVRVAMIYEGTNHVLALELVGQKLAADHLRVMGVFFSRLDEEIGLTPNLLGDELAAMKKLLLEAVSLVFDVRPFVPENMAAIASKFLNVLGMTALVFVWSRLARVFPEGLELGRFFSAEALIEAQADVHRIIASGSRGSAPDSLFESS